MPLAERKGSDELPSPSPTLPDAEALPSRANRSAGRAVPDASTGAVGSIVPNTTERSANSAALVQSGPEPATAPQSFGHMRRQSGARCGEKLKGHRPC